MYSSTSLPEDLTIKESRIAGSGVFSSIHLRKGTLFGPYQGVKRDGRIDKTKLDTSYYWAVSSLAYFLVSTPSVDEPLESPSFVRPSRAILETVRYFFLKLGS